ncbi:MAG: right-handed parallel beta-helix repeat-containing protein, partial [Mycobacterium sp.]
SEDIALTGLTVRSAPDMTGWTAEDWRERAAYVGVRFRWSKRVSLTDSTIRGVHFGVGSDSPGTRIERVAITMFAGDGIQITGSGSRIIDNRIEGCVSVNGNHPDAIQSWSFGDPVSDILIAGNTIIEAGADENLRCHLQGIASFDGRPAGWAVVGNTVEVGSWHGISLYGADDAVISGNTVIDARPDDEIVPRILLAPGKDGRPATGITEGNIAP